MNILFIAPPAAGKGTCSKILGDRYHLKHISTGDLLREEARKNPFLKKKMEEGTLIEDGTVLSLLKKKLMSTMDSAGRIFDGFPRNLSQAEAFDEILHSLGEKVDYVFLLDLKKDVCEKRILYRLSCPQCGRVYNREVLSRKPRQEGLCDDCHCSLIKREDDNKETFEKRFENYEKETKPLLSYYENKKNLYKINADRDTEEIIKDMINLLEQKKYD